MEDLTAFQRDILFLLSDMGPEYGLAIKERLEEYYGEDVNHGRLYPNLNELAENGYLEIGERDKRTNEYDLTDKGHEAVRTRLKWQEQVSGIPA
jgi:PadR family transcriptional regulator PadR